MDSTNKLEPTIAKAVELGLSGLAITDHESLSGHIKAMAYVRDKKKSGEIPENFKLILGDEIYLIDSLDEVQNNYQSGKTKYYHFILLAKDKEGYHQLRQISSQAWKNRFVQFKMERVPIEKKQLEEIIGDNKGHLIASTACLGGELADIIVNDKFDEFYPFVDWCRDTFGNDNFYMEMQPNDSIEQEKVNKAIVKLSEQSKIPFIITTDAHYLTAEYREIHEAYLKSRENDDREVAEFYKTTYLMTEDEIHEWMDEQIGKENVDTALANTLRIANVIEEFDMFHNQVVPKVDIPEFELQHLWKDFYDKYEYLNKFAYSDDEHDRYYLYLCEKGFLEKEPYQTFDAEEYEKHVSRINDELEAIWESSINIGDKISNYYITYLSLKDMMWDDSGGNSIVGVGRGSVAAFYTCYLTGVQELNSYNLDIPYWRHLHATRPEMPDRTNV